MKTRLLSSFLAVAVLATTPAVATTEVPALPCLDQSDDGPATPVEELLTMMIQIAVAVGQDPPSLDAIDHAYEMLNDRVDRKVLADHDAIFSLYKEMLDLLTKARIADLDREAIRRRYARASQQALLESLENVVGSNISFSPIALFNGVSGGARELHGYHERQRDAEDARDQGLLEQRKEQIEDLNEFVKRLVDTEIDLMREAALRDTHVAQSDALKGFHSDIGKPDAGDRVKRLLPRTEDAWLQHYGPLWFHLGLAHHEVGNHAEALKSFNQYLERGCGSHYMKDPFLLPLHVTRATAANALLSSRRDNDDAATAPSATDAQGLAESRLAESALEDSMDFLMSMQCRPEYALAPGIGVTAGVLLALHGEEEAREKGIRTLNYFLVDDTTKPLARDAMTVVIAELSTRDPDGDGAERLRRRLAEIDGQIAAGEDDGLIQALHELRMLQVLTKRPECEDRLGNLLAQSELSVDETYLGFGSDRISLRIPTSIRQQIRVARLTIGGESGELVVGTDEDIVFEDFPVRVEAWRAKGISKASLTIRDNLGEITLEALIRHRFDEPPVFRWRSAQYDGRAAARRIDAEPPPHLSALGEDEGPMLAVLASLEAQVTGDSNEDVEVSLPVTVGDFTVIASNSTDRAVSDAQGTDKAEVGVGPRRVTLRGCRDPKAWTPESHVTILLENGATKIEIPGKAVDESLGAWPLPNSWIDLTDAVVIRDDRRFKVDPETGFFTEIEPAAKHEAGEPR